MCVKSSEKHTISQNRDTHLQNHHGEKEIKLVTWCLYTDRPNIQSQLSYWLKPWQCTSQCGRKPVFHLVNLTWTPKVKSSFHQKDYEYGQSGTGLKLGQLAPYLPSWMQAAVSQFYGS